jgi:hypothetical protein
MSQHWEVGVLPLNCSRSLGKNKMLVDADANRLLALGGPEKNRPLNFQIVVQSHFCEVRARALRYECCETPSFI